NQLGKGNVPAYPGVLNEFDSETPEQIDLLAHDLLRELETWNAVKQNASRLRPCVVDRAGMAAQRELFCDCKARGAGADDGDSLAGLRLYLASRETLGLPLRVGDKELELADLN